jgi:endonuclease/exonuclease/phosphatase family metal-dependent hydrolase
MRIRKIIYAISFIIASLAGQGQPALNVISFNIRLNHAGDSLNAWPYRKDMAASQILFLDAHIVGVQEALQLQMDDLQQRLPGFKFVGVGRADGKKGGEYSAIFYDTSRLKVLQTATFWLAEKTNVPGLKGWDAAIERIVTWALFKDKKTGKEFYHFNTHFDHIGKTARRESSRLILQKVKELAGNKPVIVTGDFNAKPTDEPILVLVDKQDPAHLIDAKSISKSGHYGPTGTFTGFQSKETSDEPIDYIFIKNGISVLKHATLSQTWGGRFSSDHFPVFATVVIP